MHPIQTSLVNLWLCQSSMEGGRGGEESLAPSHHIFGPRGPKRRRVEMRERGASLMKFAPRSHLEKEGERERLRGERLLPVYCLWGVRREGLGTPFSPLAIQGGSLSLNIFGKSCHNWGVGNATRGRLQIHSYISIAFRTSFGQLLRQNGQTEWLSSFVRLCQLK